MVSKDHPAVRFFRKLLGALHHWLVTPPAYLPRRYADFYALSNYTHCIGLSAHSFFLVIFCLLKIKVLAWFNVFSVALFASTLLASKRGMLNTGLLAGGLEVAFHQGAAVIVLGLGPAFHHYIVILSVVVLFFQHIPMWLRIIMAILPLADYIGIYIYGLHHEPWIQLSPGVVNGLSAMNVTFFVATLMGICIYFQHSVQQARRQAEKLAQAKTLFLANMSHELRTPLNAILGFAQILQRSEGLNAQERRNLSTINRSGEHLLQLINDILDMSKLEEGKFVLQRAPFDLHQLLSEVRVMFSLAARQKGIELSVEHSPDLSRYLCGDELRLRQVLINLMGNALKFTVQGSVRLLVNRTDNDASAGGRMMFRVQDTGGGIAKHELNDLFKIFTQTTSGRESRKGTGLGLALSKRFVELMGGRIGVESELGKGSTFWFELPEDVAVGAQVDDDRKAVKITGVSADAQQRFMLVVDDNADNRDLLLQVLRGLGFRAESANDGAAGVAEWERLSPDLIWMDLQMPVLDGQEATRIIKQRAREAGLPAPKIVAITASSLAGDRIARKEGGFDGYVSKPFRESQIHAVLTQLLDVEFSYASAPLPEAEMVTEGSGDDLARNLEQIDPALRRQLAEASTLADFDAAREAIRQIAAVNPRLGESLDEFLENYRFDVLQELTQESPVMEKSTG